MRYELHSRGHHRESDRKSQDRNENQSVSHGREMKIRAHYVRKYTIKYLASAQQRVQKTAAATVTFKHEVCARNAYS